jgi:class 3 adenylate cyclase
LAPSVAHDAAFARWFASYGRMAATPTAAVTLARMNTGIDIRGILPAIHVPTLVIHRKGDRDVDIESGRHLARNIPGARLIELDGEDHLWWVGDSDGIVAEIQEFLTGSRPPPEVDRQLMTILFTDIVGSTEKATEMGDRAWRELLGAHNEAIRRELARFRGHEVKTTGDGFLATFDGPARSLQCAKAIRTAVAGLGLSLRIGVHTGECEILGADVGGVGVHLAARVMSEAAPGEILVTGTVRDLVSGSGVEFQDRGMRALKGFPGTWPLLALP